jgi:hypothetical protein
MDPAQEPAEGLLQPPFPPRDSAADRVTKSAILNWLATYPTITVILAAFKPLTRHAPTPQDRVGARPRWRALRDFRVV